MAKERSSTPEQELLKIIENPTSEDAKKFKPRGIKRRGLSFLSFRAWISRFSFSKERLKEWVDGKRFRELDIKAINKVLGLCVFILAAYFTINLSMSVMDFKKKHDFKIGDRKITESVDIPERSVLKKTASYYLDKVRQRDIFNVKVEEVALDTVQEEDAVESKAPTSKIITATQDLKLVGISWSDDPDAMIEDTKALRTFFVKRGEMIGDVKVKAIFRDKVLLGYEGEEIEIK